jgi:hypothetical protein
MSHIGQRFTHLLIKQINLVILHQQLAEDNKPNQLVDMAEGLVSLTAAIGNANGVEIVNITEEGINLLFEKAFLENRGVLTDEPLEEHEEDN